MEISSIKLFLNIVLIFTAVSATSNFYNSTNCSLILGPSPTTKVVPKIYYIQLMINPEAGTISTIADIIINVTQSTTNINLHVHKMETNILASKIMMIESLSSNCSHGYSHNNLQNVNYCEENDILNLEFETNISNGFYCLHLELTSNFFVNDGIISFLYNSSENDKKQLITNLYTPNAIRRLFPCWDNPEIKATFNISIRHPANYTVLSNAPVWYKSIAGKDMLWTYFRKISWLPTYLFAIVMISNIKMNNSFKSTNFIWHQLNKTKEYGYAEEIAHLSMFHFTKYTGIPGSDIFSKIDHVIIPNAPMKSVGGYQCIIYREKDVIYNITSHSLGQKINVAKLVTYEMARQWLVGFISPYLTSDLWINEMLASFFSYDITAEFLEAKNLMPLFVVQNLQTVLDSIPFLELEPIIHKTKDDNGIDGLLYPLLYHKKAFVLIRMLNYFFTPHVLEKAVAKYIYTLDTEDLWTILKKEPHENSSNYTIKEIMNSWLTKAHYPTLSIIQKDRRRLVYFTSETRKKNNNLPKWKIPINFITRSNLTNYNIKNVIWIEHDEMEIIANLDPTDFYILNVEQYGLYRVNYDHKNWLMISSYLQFENYLNIPVINRAQLINDAYYYTIKGELDSFIFVELIRYLKRETDYIPWYPVFNIMVDMSTYLQSKRAYATKLRFLYILHELLQRVGMYEIYTEDDELKKSLRLLALRWACKLGHINCRKSATTRLTAYIRNLPITILPTWKDWILCTGMMMTTAITWTDIFHISIRDKNLEFFDYLSCSENVDIIIHYLSLMLEKNFERHLKRQITNTYLSVVKKHVMKNTVLEYVLKNYNETVNRFPDLENGTLIVHIIMSVNSKEALEQIHTFANRIFPYDNQLQYVLQNTNAIRKSQIMKEQKKFEMF